MAWSLIYCANRKIYRLRQRPEVYNKPYLSLQMSVVKVRPILLFLSFKKGLQSTFSGCDSCLSHEVVWSCSSCTRSFQWTNLETFQQQPQTELFKDLHFLFVSQMVLCLLKVRRGICPTCTSSVRLALKIIGLASQYNLFRGLSSCFCQLQITLF